MGNKNSGRRGPMPLEIKQKIAAAHRGKPKSEAHKQKLREHIRSEEHNNNLKNALNKEETKDKRKGTMLSKYGVEHSAHRPDKNIFCIEYWLNKGFSAEEAKDHISKMQSEFSNRREHGVSHWTTDYWTSKGFSIDEAKKKVSELQVKNNQKAEPYTVSKVETSLLDNLENMLQIKITRGPILFDRFKVDGLIEGHNIVIEFFGEFWHMKPTIFNADDIHPVTGWEASSKWSEDNGRIKYLEKAGYKVFVFWENESIENNVEMLKKEIVSVS